MSKNYIVFDSMMVPPQKNIFLLLYCIIFDNKFLLILRNSKLLSINFLCVTLSHMSIVNAERVPLVKFTGITDTPHTYTPEFAQLYWDTFFCHFRRKSDGTIIYTD